MKLKDPAHLQCGHKWTVITFLKESHFIIIHSLHDATQQKEGDIGKHLAY